MNEYYAILGVHRWANEAEIKSAYRRLARRYHPDLCFEKGAEEQFKRVNEAYSALTAEKGKRRQVAPLVQSPGTPAASEHDYREIVSAPYFRAFMALALPDARDNPLGHAERLIRIKLPLESVYGGGVIRLGEARACIDIHVPRGIRPGQIIRIEDFGSGAHVRFQVEYEEHPRFRIENGAVVTDLVVDAAQIEAREELSVPTLGGDIRVRLPAGARDGMRLRLAGRGLPALGGQGDQFVCLKVTQPADRGARALRWVASNDCSYRGDGTGACDTAMVR